jgi:predicted outer membrane protein
MKSVALRASTLLCAVTIVGCGSGTPTSPSQVAGGFSPATANRALGDSGDVGMVTARQLAGTDGEYATAEANSNYTLMQFGIVAEQRGDRSQVKTFARQLIQDFSTAQDQLSEWAGEDTAQRANFSAADKATHDTLRGLSGSDLDRAFVTAIVAELTSTRTELRNAGALASSASVRDHAAAMDLKLGRLLAQALDLDTYL